MALRLYVTLALVSLIPVCQTHGDFQPDDIYTVQPGANVTLKCSFANSKVVYWFQQGIGKQAQILAVIGPDNKIYNGTKKFLIQPDVTSKAIKIFNVKPSETGMYYCGTRNHYDIVFGQAVFLSVQGEKANMPTVVQEAAQPGDSVSLQCTIDSETCAGGHRVYWVRHGPGESLPAVIYTHGNRSDECERSPEAGSPTQSCVYQLPKRNISRSDAATYYCAVLSCGHILFGNGTRLDVTGCKDDVLLPVTGGLGAALLLCIFVIVLLIWTRNNRYHGAVCCSKQAHGADSTQDTSTNPNQEELNYAALHFVDKSHNRRKKKEGQLESTYSEVKLRGLQ